MATDRTDGKTLGYGIRLWPKDPETTFAAIRRQLDMRDRLGLTSCLVCGPACSDAWRHIIRREIAQGVDVDDSIIGNGDYVFIRGVE
jgi:hypothetical protein